MDFPLKTTLTSSMETLWTEDRFHLKSYLLSLHSSASIQLVIIFNYYFVHGHKLN